jgi:hypothetical protein
MLNGYFIQFRFDDCQTEIIPLYKSWGTFDAVLFLHHHHHPCVIDLTMRACCVLVIREPLM